MSNKRRITSLYVNASDVIQAIGHSKSLARTAKRHRWRRVECVWDVPNAVNVVGMTFAQAHVAVRDYIETERMAAMGVKPGTREPRPFRWRQNVTKESDLLVGMDRGDQRGRRARAGLRAISISNPQEVVSLVSHRERVYGRAMTMPDALRVSPKNPNLALIEKR
jgi:hypothetical protein